MLFHDFFEIGLCHEGSGVLIMDSGAVPYKAGDLCVIRQFDSHYHIGTRGVKTIWSFIFFDAVKLLKAALYDRKLADTSGLAIPNLKPILSGDTYPELKQAYMMFYNEYKEDRKWQKDAGVSLVVFFLTILNRIKSTDIPLKLSEYSRETGRIEPALALIGKGFREELSVGSLAGACGMSSRNFTRRFTQATGKPPMEYVNEVRIAMAKSDLLSTRKKVIEVASDNGFTSLSNFGKAFYKAAKMSPREYRKSNV